MILHNNASLVIPVEKFPLINLPKIWESLKRTVQPDFTVDPHFFIIRTSLDHGLYHRVIQILVSKKLTPRSIIHLRTMVQN